MIRKHWKVLLLTSVIILLPVLAGMVMWDQLPDRMPTHWNMQGEIDGWSSKPFAVFGLSLLMLGVQWLCVFATGMDPKRDSHSEKILHLVFWIIPVLSVVLYTLTYMAALGREVRMETVMPVLIGLLLTLVGNYLPKCRQNYTIGIKIPWTLNSEENWNRTHRFAGRLWVVCGFVVMFTGFFGSFRWTLPVMIVMVAGPMVYSYLLYRRQTP